MMSLASWTLLSHQDPLFYTLHFTLETQAPHYRLLPTSVLDTGKPINHHVLSQSRTKARQQIACMIGPMFRRGVVYFKRKAIKRRRERE